MNKQLVLVTAHTQDESLHKVCCFLQTGSFWRVCIRFEFNLHAADDKHAFTLLLSAAGLHTFLAFKFIRISSFMFSVTGV